jgi:hypothetical protein
MQPVKMDVVNIFADGNFVMKYKGKYYSSDGTTINYFYDKCNDKKELVNIVKVYPAFPYFGSMVRQFEFDDGENCELTCIGNKLDYFNWLVSI